MMIRIRNRTIPNFLWYCLSENGLNALTPDAVNESKIMWLHNPKNIEYTSRVRLILKGEIRPILIEMSITAMAIKNTGYNLLFRKSNPNEMITINRIIRFSGLVKSKSYDDNPIPKNRNNEIKRLKVNTPKIEWVNPLWLESKNMPPKKTITKPK